MQQGNIIGNKAIERTHIMATLAEIRAKLQQQENRGGSSGSQGGDRAIYAHWNIPEGSTAKLRLQNLQKKNKTQKHNTNPATRSRKKRNTRAT